MSFPDMAWAILRKWWVFLPVFAVGILLTAQLRDTGAEFIAEAQVTVVLPRTDNTLLDSTRSQYKGPAIIAAVEMLDDEYRATVSELGLPDTYEFDWVSRFPVITIVLRGPNELDVSDGIEFIADEYVDKIDEVQSDRNVIGAARFRGVVTGITYPPIRPPGSTRALFGLVVASTMLAGGVAYGVDQFVLPPSRSRRRRPAGLTGEPA
jgi:hypothetical protein